MPRSMPLSASLSFSTYLYFLSLSPCISFSLSVTFHFSFYHSLFQDIDEDYDPMAGYDSNVLNHPGGTYSPPILFYDHYFTFIFWSIQFLTLKEPFFELISIFKKIDNADHSNPENKISFFLNHDLHSENILYSCFYCIFVLLTIFFH